MLTSWWQVTLCDGSGIQDTRDMIGRVAAAGTVHVLAEASTAHLLYSPQPTHADFVVGNVGNEGVAAAAAGRRVALALRGAAAVHG